MNGPGLLRTIKDDLRRWTSLPLSLWGRVDVLKMNVLPRLTYIISSIPLQIPQYWFQEINTIFSQFTWKDRKPRINHKKLSMPRRTGGLGVPNLYLYYLSYNARFPIVWGYGATLKKANWDSLEGQIITENNKSISLNSLWYSPKSNLNNP